MFPVYGRYYLDRVRHLPFEEKETKGTEVMTKVLACCMKNTNEDDWCNRCIERLMYFKWIEGSYLEETGAGVLYSLVVGRRVYPLISGTKGAPDEVLQEVEDFNRQTLYFARCVRGNSERWEKDTFLKQVQ